MKTKADFKAKRELLGMSQQLLADLLKVDIRSVKRWESPTATAYKNAPQDAWDILDHYLERQTWTVETALDKFDELNEQTGLAKASLTYWFSEKDYENAHPGEGKFWQMANANSRLIASQLLAEGYEVDFNFGGLKEIKAWQD